MDKAEPLEMLYTYALICVEIDSEKVLPKRLQTILDYWMHIQFLD